MNLSVKNMLFAFVAGLVVFSLLMTALCVGMFNAEISVAKKQNAEAPISVDTVNLDKAALFNVKNADEDSVNFCVLVMIDSSSKRVLLTPVHGTYLIPYKNALSYVSSVYLELGNAVFPEIVRAFSGILLEESNVYDKDDIVNYDSFKENIFDIIENDMRILADWSSYSVEDFTVVLKENQTNNTHEHIKQIDTEKSVEKFRTILGKN